jgi:hypothetical protein
MSAETQPLSSNQKKAIMCLTNDAFGISIYRGAIDNDANFDRWRKEQYGTACGRPAFGLREAQNDDFRLICGRLLVILGNAEAAFEAFIGSGPENEARRRMAHRLAAKVGILAKLWGAQRKIPDAEAAKQAWAYTLAIARDKAKGQALDTLPAKTVEQIGFTIINRISAHRGVGSTENRNKSQRTRKPKASRAECANRLPSSVSPPQMCADSPPPFRAFPLVSV